MIVGAAGFVELDVGIGVPDSESEAAGLVASLGVVADDVPFDTHEEINITITLAMN